MTLQRGNQFCYFFWEPVLSNANNLKREKVMNILEFPVLLKQDFGSNKKGFCKESKILPEIYDLFVSWQSINH